MTSIINKRYRLQRKIGEGGMGEIFEAVDERTQEFFAVKLFWSDYAQGEGLQRFQRECKTISQLNHPGIVKVVCYGIENGRCFIVMEMVHGPTLQQLIDNNSLTLEEITRITLQLCSTLEYIHAQNIIHRDIKPSNIIITNDGAVKIMDFGLAWGRGSTSITRTGQIMGTIAYVSPEQAKGKKADHRSDLYSLGVVLYQILTGKLPFEGSDAVTVIMGHTSITPLPLRTVKKDIPHSLERIVLKLLSKKPGDRFQSASELREALEAFQKKDDEKINLMTSEISLKAVTDSKPMISRENELKLMKNHLDRLFIKKGGIVLLTGEKGIGKSRLIQEVEKLVNVQMMEYYSVNCDGEPFALGKMIKSIIRSLGKDQLDNELQTDITYFEKLQQDPVNWDESIINTLSRVWNDLIIVLTKELPTVLVFDNLHKADSVTLNILKASANYSSDKSLLIVVIIDDGYQEKSSLLNEFIDEINVTAKIELKPFSLNESKEFLKDIFNLNEKNAHELSIKFRKKSVGNPLLLRELVENYLHRKERIRQLLKQVALTGFILLSVSLISLTTIYYLPEDNSIRKWIFSSNDKNPFVRTEVWLDWQEYQKNPVFIPANQSFSSPSIVDDGGLLRMWYVSDGKVYYAESPDGITWSKDKRFTTPVLTANTGMARFDSEELLSVYVMKEEKNYKMWYSGCQSDKIPRIGYAVSSDGINWIKISGNAYRGAVLDIGKTNSIDESGVSNPCVQKVGAEYYMWYEGKYTASYPFQSTICLAKSSDGIIWKRDKNNPVFSASTATIDVFDSRNVGNPCVLYDGKMFRMWYFGTGYGNNIGYAVSENGTKWFRMKHLIFLGALFGNGQKGVSEMGRSYPVVVNEKGNYKMWYVGTNTEGIHSLAFATSSPLRIPNNEIPKNASVVVDQSFDDNTNLTDWKLLGLQSEKRFIKIDTSISKSNPSALLIYNEEENDIGTLLIEKKLSNQKREMILDFDILLSSPVIAGQWLFGYADDKGVFKPTVDFMIAGGEIWSNHLNGDPLGRTQMKGSFNYGDFKFEKDKWYNIKIKIDIAESKFAIWVDGILLERCLEIGRFSFSNVNTINSFRIGTVENGKSYRIDNLKLLSIPDKE